jgi:hypothetical protein
MHSHERWVSKTPPNNSMQRTALRAAAQLEGRASKAPRARLADHWKEEVMSKNLFVYVRPEIVASWRLRSLTYGSGKGPLGYGSNAPVFHNNVDEDTVLWAFTMPTVRLPQTPTRYYRPSLVARIRVAFPLTRSSCLPDLRVYSRVGSLLKSYNYVAYSDPEESLFSELNDATPGLTQLRWQGNPIVKDPPAKLVRLHGPTQALRRTIGVHFQAPRRVDDDSVAALRGIVGTATESTAFISYSHSGGREYALNLAEELLNQGISPWLDGFVVDPDLECPEDVARSLMSGIDRSSLFIAIVTKDYRNVQNGFNWTEAEWKYATTHVDGRRPPCCVQVARGGRLDNDIDAVFSERKLKLLAKAIADHWLSQRGESN